MKTVIFDLDGTLALIDKRRKLATKPNGKMDWDVFFDPKNISLDMPNWPVIETAKAMKAAGNRIVIFSGRSAATQVETELWLKHFGVPFDTLKMRPDSGGLKFMKDDKLKQMWLGDLFPNTNDILCVFDDRDKVVEMWRENGISCFQVAPGNF